MFVLICLIPLFLQMFFKINGLKKNIITVTFAEYLFGLRLIDWKTELSKIRSSGYDLRSSSF